MKIKTVDKPRNSTTSLFLWVLFCAASSSCPDNRRFAHYSERGSWNQHEWKKESSQPPPPDALERVDPAWLMAKEKWQRQKPTFLWRSETWSLRAGLRAQSKAYSPTLCIAERTGHFRDSLEQGELQKCSAARKGRCGRGCKSTELSRTSGVGQVWSVASRNLGWWLSGTWVGC